MSEDAPPTLADQVKDIRDHAYNVAGDRCNDGRSLPLVRMMLPLIDMLALLVPKTSVEPLYEYDVIDAHALATRSRHEGWQLVKTVVDDLTLYVNKQVLLPGNSYTTPVQDQVVGRQTRYVMRRPFDSPIAEVQRTLLNEQTRANKVTAELKKAQEELSARATAFTRLQEQRDAEVAKSMETQKTGAALIAAAEKKLADVQASERVAEAQLAKIAFALGDLKMKEILGT